MKTLLKWMLAAVFLTTAQAQDVMEFLNGTTLKGSVVEIDKEAREVVFEAAIVGQRTNKRYPYTTIHAVTWKGKRYVVTKKPEAATAAPSTAEGEPVKRSRTEVEELIDTVGASPPDWLADTESEYPESLDLSWPEKAEGEWNNRKNVGQYLWDVIYPNTNRWRSGIKLIHQIATTHEKDPVLLTRDLKTLGNMYFTLLQDYPRAAYWWREAGVDENDLHGPKLAECYWRMGNEQMAKSMLRGRTVFLGHAKLYGDMGDTRKAVEIADLIAAQTQQDHEAYLIAGDALRLAGRYREAIDYYQKVLDAGDARNEEYSQRYRGRAEESIETIRAFELFDLTQAADGTYTASSLGYEESITVEVVIAGKRIEKVEVTDHKEKQFYSSLTDIPNQIIAKQSVKGVIATSHATITAEAIMRAAASAVAEAQGN